MNINNYYVRKVPTQYMGSPPTPMELSNKTNHFKNASNSRKVTGLEQKSAGEHGKGCTLDVYV